MVDEPGQPWTSAHGLGWSLWNEAGVRYAGHGGSMPGFLAGLRVRLEDGDGSVVLTNTTSSAAPRELSGRLLDVLAQREPLPVRAWAAEGDAELLDLLGTWHWGPSEHTVRVVGEHLVVGEPGEGRGSRFARVGPDRWVGLEGYHTGEPLRVVRREDGTAACLDLASYRFTRTPYDPAMDVPGGVDRSGWR
ncbi:MAG TPA: hypothetical protein VES95_11380 [Dermatophilaceae bacterium]|nr:hypothetical protein [Dermatophilaceae bacterium]